MTFTTAEMRPASKGRFLISCRIHAHKDGETTPTPPPQHEDYQGGSAETWERKSCVCSVGFRYLTPTILGTVLLTWARQPLTRRSILEADLKYCKKQ